MAGKHVPQRTCISCRTVRGKREFVRIVRMADEHVQADATGKLSGRGAYLCRQRECWEEMLNEPHRLRQALKMDKPILEEDLVRLRQVAVNLPSRSISPTPRNHVKGAGRKGESERQRAIADNGNG